MATWSKDELRKIAEADDLHISPFREDGKTYGTPTWIWSVAVDEARLQWAELSLVPGRGTAEGGADPLPRALTKQVTFEPVDGQINDRIDEAYRAKYKGRPHLKPMISARARAATVKVMPRR